MRMTIHEGQPFYCEFVIKEPGASIPKDVTGASGTFVLSTLGHSPKKVLEQSMSVVDGPNGIMSVSLDTIQTTGLLARVGFMEDGYPPIPTYKAELNINANEPISVFVPKVYVVKQGD